MRRLPDVASTEDLQILKGSPYGEPPKKMGQKLWRLRQKLYLKAKREPKFRFYALYSLVYREDVLWDAWCRVAANNGAPGVDGVRIKALLDDEEALKAMLGDLREELRSKTYKPSPVLRVLIPKADGTRRPLGIPSVRDRVAQMAVLLVLEPIFEADFLACSHGFRPGRSAAGALDEIRQAVGRGRQEVLDADLKSYFDTIPHDKLMQVVRKRVTDGSVLKLIRQWLVAPVVEDGGPPRRPKSGTPQGGVLSPLLANAYLHWLDKLFHAADGPAKWADARLIRYADDFVICARFIGPEIWWWLEKWLSRMGLSLNREKTRVVRVARGEGTFDFLGFTFRMAPSVIREGTFFCMYRPSQKSAQRARERVRELTSSRRGMVPIGVVVGQLNQYLRGWSGYYRKGYPGQTMRDLDWFACCRLERFLKRRSQRPYRLPKGVSWYGHLHGDLGLIRVASGRRLAMR